MDIRYQRPRKLEIEELTPTYGKFYAEPFERGYGTTVGIALRRVLLSLMQGAGVTAIRIDGVLHEFSIIPGIYEDVLNIILNIKNIPFKLNVDKPKIVSIEKEGEGEVRSGDIIADNDVEVLDKNVHIAYLEKGAKFKADLVINFGIGFKLSDQNYDESLAVDFIPVDTNFNPVEKVKYTIQPSRVGKRTDYEKLVMEIWTNGSVSPKDTISKAGKILRDHLTIYIDYQDKEMLKMTPEQEITAAIEKKGEILEKDVKSLGLSIRASRCLEKLGVDYVFELVEKTEHELLNSKNFGKKSLEEIIKKLSEYDLSLGQRLPDVLKVELQEKFGRKPEEESETMKET